MDVVNEGHSSRSSRRDFLRRASTGVLATAVGAFLAACRSASAPSPSAPALSEAKPSTTPAVASTAASPRTTPAHAARIPPPLRARQDRRLVLPGTPWQTPLYINRSAAEGPSVFVLGGVHGNEPGSWAAADRIADWMPDRGTLIVLPRANALAIAADQRTLPELGDLNRFYPGEPLESVNAFPMQFMANAIVGLAREFKPALLLDLHESWGFFNERTQDGTAFLGQTIASGDVEQSDRVEALVAEVNELVTEREQFTVRDRNRFGRVPDTTNRDPSWPTGGTTSLGIGRFVEGVLPVLVEMGQQNQPKSRRSELHQLVVRTALTQARLLNPA